jgi:hypothetical protein
MRRIFDKIEILGEQFVLTLSQGAPAKVVAINTEDFNRWRDAVEVKDFKAITDEEMLEIVGEHPYEFLYHIL